ncbi:MAG: hypothetical protein LUH11_00045 [Candidatus Gastranaerophilales bacterium]|nr:hypothetical protein [Candidatus Gastranaerophilales bacterium]
MNKKFNQYVPICIILAIVVCIVIIFVICSTKYNEYNEAKTKSVRNSLEREKLEREAKSAEEEKQAEAMKLKSIKPIYETDINSTTENLSVFGKMFEEIIKKAQQDGLLIRSIEYNMHPETDPVYINAQESYNVCDLKFFFVGSYSQLQSFLTDLNNNFPYLIYLSAINVSAFPSNTDYLLIKTTITLYSKKPQSSKAGRNRK